MNSIWFLRRHARWPQWLRFFAYDVLSLPVLWAWAAFRGRGRSVLAKAVGIYDGLRGKRVTGELIEESSSWLW